MKAVVRKMWKVQRGSKGIHTIHLNTSLPLGMVARPIVVWCRDGSPGRRSILDVDGIHQAERGSMALIRQVNWVGEEFDGLDF